MFNIMEEIFPWLFLKKSANHFCSEITVEIIISCFTFAENEYFYKKRAQLHEAKTKIVNHPEKVCFFLYYLIDIILVTIYYVRCTLV